jgi:hypothetical protein
MSEEFCDGVKILLKRMESNPEEFKGQDNKWHNVVPTPTGYGEWSHALNPEEIQALKDGIRKIYRKVYTDLVMSTLLYETEEELVQVQPGTWINVSGTGGGGSGMLATNSIPPYNPYNPYQNAYPQRSAFAESQPPKEKLSLSEILKNKLKYSL